MDDYVKMLEGAGVVGGSGEMMASNHYTKIVNFLEPKP